MSKKINEDVGLSAVATNNTGGVAGIGVAVGGDQTQAEPGVYKRKKKRLKDILKTAQGN